AIKVDELGQHHPGALDAHAAEAIEGLLLLEPVLQLGRPHVRIGRILEAASAQREQDRDGEAASSQHRAHYGGGRRVRAPGIDTTVPPRPARRCSPAGPVYDARSMRPLLPTKLGPVLALAVVAAASACGSSGPSAAATADADDAPGVGRRPPGST